MNSTRDLQDPVRDDSMAEELGLVYSDPEITFLITWNR